MPCRLCCDWQALKPRPRPGVARSLCLTLQQQLSRLRQKQQGAPQGSPQAHQKELQLLRFCAVYTGELPS